jgi:CheY-like chemotaxis protein
MQPSELSGRRKDAALARILYLEDHPRTRGFYSGVLEAAGHCVTPCASPSDAVNELSGAHYDLLLADWRLGPEDAGSAILSANSRGIPTVVVSGFVPDAFAASKAALYLEKPVAVMELVRLIGDLANSLQKSKATSATE